MDILANALQWLGDSANWLGDSGILVRLAQHLGLSLLALVIAAALMIPLGIFIGHTGKGAVFAGAFTGGLRAIPTLGLLTLLALFVGVGYSAPLISLVILAAPSLLTATYAGFNALNQNTVSAMRAMGMSEGAIISRVELPLAMPVILGGARSALLQVVATATLAAYVADLGLGRYIFLGLKSRQYFLMLAGALLVIALTLLLDFLTAWLQRRAERFANPVAAAEKTTATPSAQN